MLPKKSCSPWIVQSSTTKVLMYFQTVLAASKAWVSAESKRSYTVLSHSLILLSSSTMVIGKLIWDGIHLLHASLAWEKKQKSRWKLYSGNRSLARSLMKIWTTWSRYFFLDFCYIVPKHIWGLQKTVLINWETKKYVCSHRESSSVKAILFVKCPLTILSLRWRILHEN